MNPNYNQNYTREKIDTVLAKIKSCVPLPAIPCIPFPVPACPPGAGTSTAVSKVAPAWAPSSAQAVDTFVAAKIAAPATAAHL